MLNLEKNKKVQSVWHLDETYVNKEWRYLYRATDGDGHTLDIQLRRTRDHQATYMFMKRLVKDCGEPTVLTTKISSGCLNPIATLYPFPHLFQTWQQHSILYIVIFLITTIYFLNIKFFQLNCIMVIPHV